ncbi:CLUMA_CG018201, isoform B [Clunio marinus]|uniref:CLUMA_CG018201, isoform B n=1 Tax=Clunio marinus TaxID=568069 RepID=A0A1J1IYF0_9DIPT|nr:CLUMA_CG018201, isoform B [Clunio marinus]
MSNHEERNECRTYFKLVELSRWLGITPFEILINLLSFFIFSIFLTLTLDGTIDFFIIQQHQNETDQDGIYRSDVFQKPVIDWFKLFSVLFCADIMNAYFCFIVILRMYLQNMQSMQKLFWTLNFIILTGLFKYLIALKLTGTSLEWTEVCSPIFVLLQLFALRACQIKNS